MADNPILHYYKSLPLPTFLQNSNSLRFLAEIIVAVKHQQLIPFYTNYDYKETLLINEDLFSHGFLHNTM